MEAGGGGVGLGGGSVEEAEEEEGEDVEAVEGGEEEEAWRGRRRSLAVGTRLLRVVYAWEGKGRQCSSERRARSIGGVMGTTGRGRKYSRTLTARQPAITTRTLGTATKRRRPWQQH